VRPLRALAALLLVVAFPKPAAAEWHFTPMVGTTFFANTSLVDLEHATGHSHFSFGGSVALLGSGIFGAEALIIWTPGLFTGNEVLVSKSHAIAFMGNAVLTTPRRWTEYNLRPFLSGGFGRLQGSRTESHNVFSEDFNIGAFNIGGGAIGFLSKNTGLRFDLRYYSSLTETDELIAFGKGHLRYMTASVGVVIRR
jgi:Outer membrane protein beta-barrel domain